MSRQDIAAALNVSLAEVTRDARRRFATKSRLSGPTVTDRQIWDSVQTEMAAQAERALYRRKMAPYWAEMDAKAWAAFDAADRAAGRL